MIEISIPGQSASKEENKQQLIRLTEIKMKKQTNTATNRN